MTKAFEKLRRGLNESIVFAKGECEHDWKREWPVETATANDERATYRCTKCKVRITRFSATR